MPAADACMQSNLQPQSGPRLDELGPFKRAFHELDRPLRGLLRVFLGASSPTVRRAATPPPIEAYRGQQKVGT